MEKTVQTGVKTRRLHDALAAKIGLIGYCRIQPRIVTEWRFYRHLVTAFDGSDSVVKYWKNKMNNYRNIKKVVDRTYQQWDKRSMSRYLPQSEANQQTANRKVGVDVVLVLVLVLIPTLSGVALIA